MKVKKVKVRKNLCLEGREVFAHKTSIQGGGGMEPYTRPQLLYTALLRKDWSAGALN